MQQFLEILSREIQGSFAGVAWQPSLIRLTLAGVFGALIGFEREIKGKAAGMRTHTLVALAACLFALVAMDVTLMERGASESFRMDPLRLIEAITGGVAFLGAGTIIVSRANVRGLTTAAGMWLSGAVGLATGVGNIGLAAMATVLALIILGPLRWMEPEQPEE